MQLRPALWALVLFSVSSSASWAQVPATQHREEAPAGNSSDFTIGFIGGPLLPGTVSNSLFAPNGSKTTVGFFGRLAGDAMVGPNLSVGPYVLFAYTHFDAASGAVRVRAA